MDGIVRLENGHIVLSGDGYFLDTVGILYDVDTMTILKVGRVSELQSLRWYTLKVNPNYGACLEIYAFNISDDSSEGAKLNVVNLVNKFFNSTGSFAIYMHKHRKEVVGELRAPKDRLFEENYGN